MPPDEREWEGLQFYRRIHSSPLWRSMNAGQRVVWIEMLISANWKDDELWYGTKRITVKRGQFSHSEDELARRAKVGRQVVRSTFALLLAAEAVIREPNQPSNQPSNQRTNQSPTITTIVNYDEYQGNDDEPNQPSNQPSNQRTNQSPTLRNDDHPVGSSQLDFTAVRPTPAEGEKIRSPAGSSPPKPKKHADPRFAPLRAAFEAEFFAVTGQIYRWQGEKDATALHRLIAVPVEEFRAKAKAGLKANGFVRSPTVAQLAAKWNDIAAAKADGVLCSTRGMVPSGRAEDFVGTPWDDP